MNTNHIQHSDAFASRVSLRTPNTLGCVFLDDLKQRIILSGVLETKDLTSRQIVFHDFKVRPELTIHANSENPITQPSISS